MNRCSGRLPSIFIWYHSSMGRIHTDFSRVASFCGLLLAWGATAWVLLQLFDPTRSNVIFGLVVLIVYSLTPLAAALIITRAAHWRSLLSIAYPVKFFLLPVAVFTFFVAGLALLTFLFGNVMQVTSAGHIAVTNSELAYWLPLNGLDIDSIAVSYPIVVVWGIFILIAVGLGWTIHGLFAVGEEYGWRGFLWGELRHLGVARANIVTGVIWGLWHAPLVLYGLNYGASGWLGVAAITAFTVAMSFLLSALREHTGSIVPGAALHGMVNGLGYVAGALFIAGVPPFGGILGILSSSVVLVLGLILWACWPLRKRAT